MKARIALVAVLLVVSAVAYLAVSVNQAIKDFHSEPDGFWE